MTYDSIDAANLAINEMNGKTPLGGCRLKVSLARRQPVYNPEKSKQSSAELNINNHNNNTSLSTPEAWSAIASSLADNLEQPKARAVVSYEEDFLEPWGKVFFDTLNSLLKCIDTSTCIFMFKS